MGSLICLQFCYLPCGVYFHLQFSHIRFVSANILFTFLFSQIFGFISLCHPSSPSLFITLLLFVFFLFIPIDMFKFLYLVVFSQRIVFFSQHIVFFSQHIVFFSQHIVFSYLVLSPSATPHHPLCLVMTRIRAAIAQNPPRQFITHL